MCLSLILIIYISLQSNNLIYILKSSLSLIASFLFISSLILFYLDDYKLSNVKLLKYIQIFSFISALFVIFFVLIILVSQ